MIKLAIVLSVAAGIVVGAFAQHIDEQRWAREKRGGACTASQVTSKDTRTAVQIRQDMNYDVPMPDVRFKQPKSLHHVQPSDVP